MASTLLNSAIAKPSSQANGSLSLSIPLGFAPAVKLDEQGSERADHGLFGALDSRPIEVRKPKANRNARTGKALRPAVLRPAKDLSSSNLNFSGEGSLGVADLPLLQHALLRAEPTTVWKKQRTLTAAGTIATVGATQKRTAGELDHDTLLAQGILAPSGLKTPKQLQKARVRRPLPQPLRKEAFASTGSTCLDTRTVMSPVIYPLTSPVVLPQDPMRAEQVPVWAEPESEPEPRPQHWLRNPLIPGYLVMGSLIACTFLL